MSYDVIVIGLGGMGSAAAYHLSARGQRVLGLEKFTPAHDKDPVTAALASSGSPISRTLRMCRCCCVPTSCGTSWPSRAGRDVYRMTGGLFIGPPDSLTVAGSLRASQEWDLQHDLLDDNEIRSRFPNFTPQPGDIALFEAKAGFARPELTVQAHLDLAEKAGATLRFGDEVVSGRRTLAGSRCAPVLRHLHRRPGRDLPRRVGAEASRRIRNPDHRRTSGAVLA